MKYASMHSTATQIKAKRAPGGSQSAAALCRQEVGQAAGNSADGPDKFLHWLGRGAGMLLKLELS